ncbi:hypothetical protein DRO02_03290 [archaeon]|nr:MAG: hypothetical protein DRO21_04310 [archaeon]RLG64948.1 MAG: hypothetical protein DRO02_03290 [archaeon]RLG65519.1 MAG: hypothetical protein DRN89_01890 [archaeon]HDM23873.1 hypothetical protein [Candidatus Bathyarchaeota archaeon]
MKVLQDEIYSILLKRKEVTLDKIKEELKKRVGNFSNDDLIKALMVLELLGTIRVYQSGKEGKLIELAE